MAIIRMWWSLRARSGMSSQWRGRIAPARLDVRHGVSPSPSKVPHWTGTAGIPPFLHVHSQQNDLGPRYRTGVVLSIGSERPRVEGPLFRVKTFGMKPLRHTLHGRCSDGRRTVLLTRSAGAFVPQPPRGGARRIASTASGTGRSERPASAGSLRVRTQSDRVSICTKATRVDCR